MRTPARDGMAVLDRGSEEPGGHARPPERAQPGRTPGLSSPPTTAPAKPEAGRSAACASEAATRASRTAWMVSAGSFCPALVGAPAGGRRGRRTRRSHRSHGCRGPGRRRHRGWDGQANGGGRSHGGGRRSALFHRGGCRRGAGRARSGPGRDQPDARGGAARRIPDVRLRRPGRLRFSGGDQGDGPLRASVVPTGAGSTGGVRGRGRRAAEARSAASASAGSSSAGSSHEGGGARVRRRCRGVRECGVRSHGGGGRESVGRWCGVLECGVHGRGVAIPASGCARSRPRGPSGGVVGAGVRDVGRRRTSRRPRPSGSTTRPRVIRRVLDGRVLAVGRRGRLGIVGRRRRRGLLGVVSTGTS